MSQQLGRGLFIAACLAFGLGMYVLLCHSIRKGQVAPSVALIVVTSPVIMAVCWLLIQRGQPKWPGLSHISFSAASDLLVIPAAAGVLATGWRRYGGDINPFFKGVGWLALMYIVGLAAGIGFHVMGGRADSASPILSERLHDSATSWMHNLGVTSALVATMLAMAIPLLTVSGGRVWGLVAIGVITAGWGVPLALDGLRMKLDHGSRWYFNPQWLDTQMDWSRWRPASRT